MLDYLLQYGLFLAEVTTVVIAIGVVIRFLFYPIRHAREYKAEHLEVKNLDRRFEQMADVLNHDLLNPHERKAHIKAKKKNTSSALRFTFQLVCGPRAGLAFMIICSKQRTMNEVLIGVCRAVGEALPRSSDDR